MKRAAVLGLGLGLLILAPLGVGAQPVSWIGLFGQDAGGAPAARPAAGKWELLPEAVRADLGRALERQRSSGYASPDGSYGDEMKLWRPEVHGPWSRYFFERVLQPAGRRNLLVLHAKLKHEGLWDVVDALRYVPRDGCCGTITFLSAEEDLPFRLIDRHGFGSWFRANHPDNQWGLRSPKAGAELHFRGPEKDEAKRITSVHIDLNNPGDDSDGIVGNAIKGVTHWCEDARRREKTHTPIALEDAVLAQGISVPEVDVEVVAGVRLAGLLKWKVSPYKTFGYLWLKPENDSAGWWVNDEDSREFDTVERLGGRNFPAWKLSFGNGWVVIRIHRGGGVSGTWFRKSDGEVLRFSGPLVEGRVRH